MVNSRDSRLLNKFRRKYSCAVTAKVYFSDLRVLSPVDLSSSVSASVKLESNFAMGRVIFHGWPHVARPWHRVLTVFFPVTRWHEGSADVSYNQGGERERQIASTPAVRHPIHRQASPAVAAEHSQWEIKQLATIHRAQGKRCFPLDSSFGWNINCKLFKSSQTDTGRYQADYNQIQSL